MDREERQVRHLEAIQGVVNRLAQNSFALKGWSVVLVSALFALAADKSKPVFAILACVPAFAFWILDGYFLWQERRFRALYDHMRLLEETKRPDEFFSMDASPFVGAAGSWLDAMFSGTLIPFHGVILFVILLVMLVLRSVR